MNNTVTIKSISDLDRAAGEFLGKIGDARLLAFYGQMGAGKTTFTVALCKALGVVADKVCSPTFTIISEYLSGKGDPIYHFDFYRIKKVDEVRDISFDEYAYSGYFCFMEWPELIEELLPEETVRVTIKELDNGERCLEVNGN